MSALYLGIDVSKHNLVAAVASSLNDFETDTHVFANSPSGLKKLVLFIDQRHIKNICFEATGGYERRLRRELETREDLNTYLISPRRARRLMLGLGHTAKTDKLDAIGLARIATMDVFEQLVARTQSVVELGQLLDYRTHLVQERTRLKNRQDKTLSSFVLSAQKTRIAALNLEILQIEARAAELVQQDQYLALLVNRIEQIPGLAKLSAMSFAAYLPELGSIGNKRIASLVGLAPQPLDSGKRVGKRTTRAGRSKLKRLLWLASVKAQNVEGWSIFHKRLLAAGKSKKVARVALMRKILCTLNSMVRNHTDFEPHRLLPAELPANSA